MADERASDLIWCFCDKGILVFTAKMCSRLFSSSVPRHVHDTRVWQMATCQNLFWHALLRAKNAFGTSVYWWHAHGELKFQVYGTPLSRTACQRDTRKTIGTSTCVCRIIFSLTHTCVCVRVTAFPFFAWSVTYFQTWNIAINHSFSITLFLFYKNNFIRTTSLVFGLKLRTI